MTKAYLYLGLALAATSIAMALWLAGKPWADSLVQRLLGAGRHAFWWPWVLAVAPVCAPFVSWRMRRHFSHWRIFAGLDEHWLVERWLAARVLVALLLAFLLILGALLLGLPLRLVLLAAVLGLFTGFLWPQQVLRRKAAQARMNMLRELPYMMDLLTLCVEAGLSLHAALHQVVSYAPAGPLRQTLNDSLALGRTGVARIECLQHWARLAKLPAVDALVMALKQADRMGLSLGPLLRTQAAQQRSERFLRAEKLALEAPVKMLFPMVCCIFPCTFLVIGFPVAVKLFNAGF